MERDYNKEAQSRADKKYDYEFDAIVRYYMMRSFKPFFKGGAALELGCHEGNSTVMLAEHFSDLTVIEASSEAVEAARRKAPPTVKFVTSMFENFNEDRKFDAIFLINTLEHLEDPLPALQRIRSWLAKDGQFFVLVPNAESPSRQIAVHMGLIAHNNAVTPGEWEHGHRRTYSFDTLEADVRKAGFAVRQRAGLMFKALANFQLDKALEAGIIDERYLEGIYALGMQHPAMCASIYLICTHPEAA